MANSSSLIESGRKDWGIKMKMHWKKALATVLVLCVICTLAGCVKTPSYGNAALYHVGDAVICDAVERLDISWASGSIELGTYDENTILIREETDRTLPDDLRVHWYLDGATLRVQFAASGAFTPLGETGSKKLTVTLPAALWLSAAKVSAASAGVMANALHADDVSVSTASGNMHVQCMAQNIRLSSASGEVWLDQRGESATINVDTASGPIDAAIFRADKAAFKAASGRVLVAAEAIDRLSAETTSGPISCRLSGMPSEGRFSSTSGSVMLALPEDAGFTARVNTTSGDFTSDFAMKRSGQTYACGNGAATIEVQTTSGDVSFQHQ